MDINIIKKEELNIINKFIVDLYDGEYPLFDNDDIKEQIKIINENISKVRYFINESYYR